MFAKKEIGWLNTTSYVNKFQEIHFPRMLDEFCCYCSCGENSPFVRGIPNEKWRKSFFIRSRKVCIIQDVPDGALMDVGWYLQSGCSNVFF